MSWTADRFQNPEEYIPRSYRYQPTQHHVPPKSVGARFILIKPRNQHEAYHTVFGDAATLEQCIEILRREWWPTGNNPSVRTEP